MPARGAYAQLREARPVPDMARLRALTESRLLQSNPNGVLAPLFTGGSGFFLATGKVQVKSRDLRPALARNTSAAAMDQRAVSAERTSHRRRSSTRCQQVRWPESILAAMDPSPTAVRPARWGAPRSTRLYRHHPAHLDARVGIHHEAARLDNTVTGTLSVKPPLNSVAAIPTMMPITTINANPARGRRTFDFKYPPPSEPAYVADLAAVRV